MAHATTRSTAVLAASLRRNASRLERAAGRARRGDPRGIHRARVATRRLREAVPVAVAALGGAPEAVRRRLRRLARALGPVRELDVARTVLADLAATRAWPPGAVEAITSRIDQLRRKRFSEATATLTASRLSMTVRAIRALADRMEASAAEAAVVRELVGRIDRRARALMEAIADAGTVYAAPALHGVRIAAKKLRYALELADEAAPSLVGALKSLQQRLGRLHDVQVVQQIVQELAAATRHRGRIADLTAIDQALEMVCRAEHARILPSLPWVAGLARAARRDRVLRAPGATPRRPARMTLASTRSRSRVA